MSVLTIAEDTAAVNYRYQPNVRQWWVVDENGVEPLANFPAGKEGKKEAQKFVLKYDSEAIFAQMMAIIEANLNHPEIWSIEARAIKASFLVREGHILPPYPQDAPGSYVNEIARVRSQTEANVAYAIVHTQNGIYCECADWHNGQKRDILRDYYREHPDDPDRPRFGAPKLGDGTYACKHVLAHLINQGVRQ